MNPPKLFVITTSSVEYSIYAIDLQDALETFDGDINDIEVIACLLYTSPSPRDCKTSRMPSSA